jgi:hypothetical protein
MIHQIKPLSISIGVALILSGSMLFSSLTAQAGVLFWGEKIEFACDIRGQSHEPYSNQIEARDVCCDGI